MCRNWQTRQTQNLLFLWTCGFESHHRHLMRISEKGFFFYCIGNFNEIPYAINKMLLKNIEQHLFIITNSVLILQFHPSKLRKLFLFDRFDTLRSFFVCIHNLPCCDIKAWTDDLISIHNKYLHFYFIEVLCAFSLRYIHILFLYLFVHNLRKQLI